MSTLDMLNLFKHHFDMISLAECKNAAELLKSNGCDFSHIIENNRLVFVDEDYNEFIVFRKDADEWGRRLLVIKS